MDLWQITPSFHLRSNRDTAVREKWGEVLEIIFYTAEPGAHTFHLEVLQQHRDLAGFPMTIDKKRRVGSLPGPITFVGPPGFVLRSDRAFRAHPRVGLEDRKASQRQFFAFNV